MKLAIYKKGANITYKEVMNEFSKRIFGNNTDGEAFLDELADILVDAEFPATKLILSLVPDIPERFFIDFKDKNKKVAYYLIELDDKRKFEILGYGYFVGDSVGHRFHPVFKEFFDHYNNEKIFGDLLKACGIKKLTDKIDVVMVAYAHGKPTDKKKTIHGTVKEIIDRYSEANDALRYINGAAWRFEDKNFEKLYDAFRKNYKGNLSLDAALRRGATID